MDSWEEQVTLLVEPFFRSVILALGTVSVPAGMVAVVIGFAASTVVDLSAKRFGPASDNITDSLAMLDRHSVAVFRQIFWSVDSEYLCQFHHTPVRAPS